MSTCNLAQPCDLVSLSHLAAVSQNLIGFIHRTQSLLFSFCVLGTHHLDQQPTSKTVFRTNGGPILPSGKIPMQLQKSLQAVSQQYPGFTMMPGSKRRAKHVQVHIQCMLLCRQSLPTYAMCWLAYTFSHVTQYPTCAWWGGTTAPAPANSPPSLLCSAQRFWSGHGLKVSCQPVSLQMSHAEVVKLGLTMSQQQTVKAVTCCCSLSHCNALH